mgnify:CR=1 FL=1
MPKNKIGGKKAKRGGGKNGSSIKRELTFAEDGQVYGFIVRVLGSGRFETLCYDGKTRLGTVRGKLRKRMWINQGDTVLVALHEFTTADEKCTIVWKYTPDETRNLKSYGELPENAKVNEDEAFNADDASGCPFEFTDDCEDDNTTPLDEENDNEEKNGGIDLDEI